MTTTTITTTATPDWLVLIVFRLIYSLLMYEYNINIKYEITTDCTLAHVLYVTVDVQQFFN